MARSLYNHSVPGWPRRKTSLEELKIEEPLYWSPPLGLDYTARRNRVSVQHLTEMSNFLLDQGVLRSRVGLDRMGASGLGPILGMVNFLTENDEAVPLRFFSTILQRFVSNAWANVPGAIWAASADTEFYSSTTYGNTLLFSNGLIKIWEYDHISNTVFQIPTSPQAAHLTTFGGRVIASRITGRPHAIQWSVKNNSRDWTGVGSGIEDLLSTPGGEIDLQMGVFPISDTTALVVRTNSIWLMSETGNPSAPFRFSRIHAGIGSRSPRTVVSLSGGIILLANDDIYMITEQSVKSIGQTVRTRIIDSVTDMGLISGVFNSRTKEYMIAAANCVYRYSFIDQGWSRSVYPYNIVGLTSSNTFFGEGITIELLLGTIDNLAGTIDSLIGQRRPNALFFQADSAVLQESETDFRDDTTVSTGTQVTNAIPLELRSGVLEANNGRNLVRLMDVQIEFECVLAQPVFIEYTTDGGTTWETYSSRTMPATTKPQIMTATRVVEAQSIMVRFRTDFIQNQGGITILSMIPRTQMAGRVNAT